MTKVLVTESYLEDIGDAIREVLGVETRYTPSEMAGAILTMQPPGPPMPTIVSWANGTDAEVAAMIDAAHAGVLDLQEDGGWAVGDVRTIRISAFTGGGDISHAEQDVDIVITSFDEYMNCGNVMQFDFKGVLANGNRMNSSGGNTGGYGASEMKTYTLPNLVNAMPEWIRSRLIEFSVLVGNGGTGSTIQTVNGNLMALRSEVEITGTTNNSIAGEGQQLPYYQVTANRIKPSESGKAWWTRSPKKASSSYFCYIDGSGSGNAPSVGTGGTFRIAPFGCM